MKNKLILAGLFLISGFAFAANESKFSNEQIQDIQKIVHEYLVKNPDVLVEASRVLQTREQEKTLAQTMGAIEKNKTQIFNDQNSPAIGSATPDVTLVEFFDYQCGHCKAMQGVLSDLIKQNKNIKVIFKQLPIFGGSSRYAAQAALAAAKSNNFYDFHTALLKESDTLTKDKILALAKKSGIDTTQLDKAISNPEIMKQIKDNFELAKKLQLVGTPSFIIANKNLTKFDFIPGRTTQEELQKRIDTLK